MVRSRDTDAKLYFDNFKVYEISEAGFDEILDEAMANAPDAEIRINGQKMSGFDPFVKGYNIKLPIGAEIPQVTASGAGATVTPATEVPGSAVVNIGSETYTINFAWDYSELNYNSITADELREDTAYTIGGNCKPYIDVTQKPGSEQDDKCIKYAFDATTNSLEFNLARKFDEAYARGTEDDNLVVVEYDIKTTGNPTRLKVALSGSDGTWIQRMQYDASTTWIDNNEMGPDGSVGNETKVSLGEFKTDGFQTVRIVLDKSNLNADYYIDGNKVAANQVPYRNSAATNIGTLWLFASPNTEITFDIYIDNIKTYQITRNAAKEQFGSEFGVAVENPEEEPGGNTGENPGDEPKEEPTYIINANWDKNEADTLLSGLSTSDENPGTWGVTSTANYNTLAKIAGGEGSNKYVELPYTDAGAGKVWFNFPDVTVGDSADDKLLVVSMDLMVEGNPNGFIIRVGKFNTSNWDMFGLKWGNTSLYSEKIFDSEYPIGAFNAGQFSNVKIVIDKKNLTADFYFGENTTPVLTDVAVSTAGTTINSILFQLVTGKGGTAETKMCIDNLEIYEVTSNYFN